MTALTHALRGLLAAVSAFTVVCLSAGPAVAQPAAAPVPRPITVAEALTLAAQNNLALRVAAYDVSIAQAQVAAAEALKRGTLALNGGYTRINEPSPTKIVIPAGTIPGVPAITITLPAADPNLYSVGLRYDYQIYTGGRLEAQIALAQAALQGAEAALERNKQQLILDVKQAYFAVIASQAGVEVGERLIASAQENLRVAAARVASGVSPRLDETQAEASLAGAQQAYIRARNALALSYQGLNQLLNLPLSTALQPRETIGIIPLRTNVTTLIERALESRPELVELKARLAAAQAAVVIAQSGQKPFFGLTVGGSYGNAVGTTVTGTSATSWSMGLLGTLSLFDGGLTSARVREAEQRVEQLKTAEALLRQSIEAEVRRAVINYTASAAEVAAAEKGVDASAESLRISNVRFNAGVSTNLEVVTAQSALTQSEASRLQALFNVNVARAQVDRAVGVPVE